MSQARGIISTSICVFVSLWLFITGLAFLHADNTSGAWFGRTLLSSLGVYGVSLAVLLPSLLTLKRAYVPWPVMLAFAAAALSSLFYIHVSSDDVYTNDLGGHLRYIRYIDTHTFSPYHYQDAWEGHQPPLYYYLAAAVRTLTREWIGADHYFTALRFLSWSFFSVFLLYGTLTLHRLPLSAFARGVATLVFLFWPLNLHMASKISNEPLYYALYAACFYYAFAWYQAGRRRDLAIAWILAGIALLARGNALLLFPMLLLIMAMKPGTLQQIKQAKGYSLLLGLWVADCLLLYFRRWMEYLHEPTEIFSKLSGPAYIGQKVEFGLTKLLHFDAGSLLLNPFVRFTNREMFWDCFFRTMLFGEYRWLGTGMAITLCVGALFWLMLAIAGGILSRHSRQTMFPIWIAALFPICVHIGMMWWKSTWTYQDARLIYPFIIGVMGCLAFALSHVNGRRRWVVLLLAIGFSCLSVGFFIAHPR